MSSIRIQTEDFDAGELIRRLHDHNPQVGAVAAFVGVVRDLNESRQVSTMTLEHYAGMTERELARIVDEATARWSVEDVCVVHRVGELAPTEQIVLVAVASMHRKDAFSACEFIMDYLKTRAPLWKKETTPAGERWVESRVEDDVAARKWEE